MEHILVTPTPEYCKQLQQALFKKGYSWDGDKVVRNTNAAAIFVRDDNFSMAHDDRLSPIKGYLKDGNIQLSVLSDVPDKDKNKTNIDRAIKAFDCHEKVARNYHEELIKLLDKRYKKK